MEGIDDNDILLATEDNIELQDNPTTSSRTIASIASAPPLAEVTFIDNTSNVHNTNLDGYYTPLEVEACL